VAASKYLTRLLLAAQPLVSWPAPDVSVCVPTNSLPAMDVIILMSKDFWVLTSVLVSEIRTQTKGTEGNVYFKLQTQISGLVTCLRKPVAALAAEVLIAV